MCTLLLLCRCSVVALLLICCVCCCSARSTVALLCCCSVVALLLLCLVQVQEGQRKHCKTTNSSSCVNQTRTVRPCQLYASGCSGACRGLPSVWATSSSCSQTQCPSDPPGRDKPMSRPCSSEEALCQQALCSSRTATIARLQRPVEYMSIKCEHTSEPKPDNKTQSTNKTDGTMNGAKETERDEGSHEWDNERHQTNKP